MKFYLYVLTALTISVIFPMGLSAQDQQEETQSVTTNQQEVTQPQAQTQTPTEKPVQTQTQTQTISLRNKPFPDDLNIADQFGYAIDKSSNFQDYKVIKQTWIAKLRTNVLDSVLTLKTNLKSSEVLILEKNKTIESLKSEVNSLQSELEQKNSFSFLGIMLSKKGYDSIVWFIIIGLLIVIGFVFAAFRRSHAVTSQTKKDLVEVKDEFENFRKKALKSKEEAVRQLYDELNKYKNKK
jgi:hypothetical protein